MKVSTYILPIALIFSQWAIADESKKLHQIIDDVRSYNLTQYPTMAQRAGIEGMAEKLTDMSPEALAARAKKNQEFVDASKPHKD